MIIGPVVTTMTTRMMSLEGGLSPEVLIQEESLMMKVATIGLKVGMKIPTMIAGDQPGGQESYHGAIDVITEEGHGTEDQILLRPTKLVKKETLIGMVIMIGMEDMEDTIDITEDTALGTGQRWMREVQWNKTKTTDKAMSDKGIW